MENKAKTGFKAVTAATIACCAAICAAKPPAERMDRSKLLIGAYYLQANARTEAHVKAVRDCGVDMIIGIPASDRAVLDLFGKYGLGAIALGVVPGWGGGDGSKAGKLRENNPPEKYAAGAAAFKDHPAIWAVDIGDEPSALDFPYYGEIVRSLGKSIPGMPLYLNLYPNYASTAQNNAAQTVNQLGTKTYAEHIEAYCRNVPLDYISYDFYPYFEAPEKTNFYFSRMYDNFITVSEACRRTKRSFWYIPQINSRVGNPATTVNQARFQANAALSFGAEAINWGCWCKGWWTNNVLDAEGRQTPQYKKLKRVNAGLKRVGPHYMRYKNTATRFIGFEKGKPGAPSLPFLGAPDDPGYFKASDGSPLIVGEMAPRNGKDRSRAFYITAADRPGVEGPVPFNLEFKFKGKRIKAYGANGAMRVYRKKDGTRYFKLAPCQGVLVVVQ